MNKLERVQHFLGVAQSLPQPAPALILLKRPPVRPTRGVATTDISYAESRSQDRRSHATGIRLVPAATERAAYSRKRRWALRMHLPETLYVLALAGSAFALCWTAF